MSIVDLVILILGIWRISNLLSNELGPGDIFEKLRYKVGIRYDERSQRFGSNPVAKELLCQWCNTIWIGIFVTVLYLVIPRTTVFLLLPFALSTGAILVLVGRSMQYYVDKLRGK